jgi:3-isopropylmalate dehydrogenase
VKEFIPCNPLFEFSFQLATQRRARNPKKGRVTCVGKSNVHRAMALFNKIYWIFAEHTVLTPEFGGKDGTAAVMKAVIAAIGQ